MFSLVKKALRHTKLFATVRKKVAQLEAQVSQINHKLERFERLADENEALWQFLDERSDPVFDGPSSQQSPLGISEEMLRNMKPYGDA
tara:strand:+ start:34 stop:297 length:264 start_codon:yes stop_codon:yes gene_type:complete